jgi:hypothetical protein
MAPPRKKRRAPGEGHPVHLRLPSDVFDRIDSKSKKETGWPLNRVIINELAEFPHLEQLKKLDALVRDMEVVLARYSAQQTLVEVSKALLHAVDEVLASRTDGERQRGLDKLRVLRAEMLKLDRRAKG